jgi:hypothetical protein
MDKQQQNQEAGPTAPVTSALDGAIKNPSRRLFTRAGLGASGVLLTLACKPVLGGVVCKSPSGFLSGNQSTHDTGALCAGRNPQYWKMTSSWPISKRTPFHRLFSCGPGSAFETCSLAEIVSGHQADPEFVAMHLTAALLNSRSGWTPFLSEETIQAMFLEWRTKGTYTPTVNVEWGSTDIVNYLKATQA